MMETTFTLVISDSHGNAPALTAVLAWAKHSTLTASGIQPNKNSTAPDFAAAIFLGDGLADIAPASARTGFTVPWHKVRGNGDFSFSLPDFIVLEIPGLEKVTGESLPRKLFLAHGNQYGVDKDGGGIAAAARNAGAEAALFGHTHVPHCSRQEGIFLLNPGSIGRSRSNAGATFAVLECPAAGPLKARFFCLQNRGRAIAVQELELQ
jgi:predicted phosphodiesterase